MLNDLKQTHDYKIQSKVMQMTLAFIAVKTKNEIWLWACVIATHK